MPLTVRNDTAIHESGHCIISYLNLDLFEIEFVTTNIDLSKAQDLSSLGGLKGHIKKDGETLTFQEYDVMILMCLAGMAADDVNHCECHLTRELYDNSIFAKKLNSNKYSGDCRLMIPHLQRLNSQLNVTERIYTISCQKLLHKIFTTDQIKNILLDLRNKIAHPLNQTLTGEEIIAYLDKTYLKEWKETEWIKIIDSRSLAYKKVKRTFWQKLFSRF